MVLAVVLRSPPLMEFCRFLLYKNPLSFYFKVLRSFSDMNYTIFDGGGQSNLVKGPKGRFL